MKRVQMLVREGTPHRWGEKTTAHLTHLHCCCVAVLTPIPLGARQTRAPQVPPRSHTLTRCGGMISSGSPAPSLGWSLHSSRWACFPQWVSATPVKKASAMAMVCPRFTQQGLQQSLLFVTLSGRVVDICLALYNLM